MPIPRIVVRMFPVGVMVFGTRVMSSQDWPGRPIRMVTGWASGVNDFIVRLLITV